MTDADLVSRLGIFARTFRRNAPAEVADTVIGAGYALAHWNFAAIGGSTLAADVEEAQFVAVRTAFDSAGLGIASVSGTFNMIHLDADLRALQIEQAVRLIGLVRTPSGILGRHSVKHLCLGGRIVHLSVAILSRLVHLDVTQGSGIAEWGGYFACEWWRSGRTSSRSTQIG